MRQYSLYVLASLAVFAVTSPLWWMAGNSEDQRIQAWLDEENPFLWIQSGERGVRPGDGLRNLGWNSTGTDSSPASSSSSRIRWQPFWGALLHLMTTGCLVFWLLWSGLGRGVALGAGLFFALHPGVFWSVGFPGASGTLWIGFGVALFWSCHARSGQEKSSWGWMVLALLGMGITLLCDPRGVVLLFLPWLLEKRGSLQQRVLWWLMVPFALLVWIVQWPSIFTGNPYQEWTEGVVAGIWSGVTVLGWGAEMLVGPRILSPMPAWEPEALRRYLWGFGVLFVEVVLLTKAVRGDRESRVMAMALGCTLLALVAFSGLGIPSANRVVPEMIYLAAMPAVMFGAMIWSRVLNLLRLRSVTTALVLFLLLVCGVRSMDEAEEMRSSQSLWNAVLQHEPNSFWANQEKGLHAIRMFRIDRDPQRWGVGVVHLMNAARSSHSGGSIRPAVAAARVARLWSERSGLASRRQARRWADRARKIHASQSEESRFQPGLQNGTQAWVEAADAWAAESEDRDEQAKSAMRRACFLEPSEAFWAVELGRILLRMKDFSKSREALDRAVKVDSECTQAYLLRAHLELEEGHATKALHEVGRAFEVAHGGQSRSAAWLARASVHREMGQIDLAREAYLGYLAQGKEIQASERAQIHFELAEMDIEKRLWSRALRELDQCFELDRGHLQARFREVEIRGQLLGKAFEDLLQEAQGDFDATRSDGARQASPYEVIANEGVRGNIEKRFDHLVEELDAIHKKAVSLTREKGEFIPLQRTVAKFLARLYVFQAGIRLRQGQKDLSQQLVKNALGLDPSCSEIREFRADWMQVLSAGVEAMEDQEKLTLYSKLLIRDPNHLAALKFFAGFWARKRNYREAERCYERLVKILEPMGLQHWSSVQMEAGTYFFRWSRALRRGARRNEKRYGRSAFERHQRSQRYVGKAVASFRKVLEISPSHYMARYNLGSLFYSLGDLSRAIEEYESILDKTSDLEKTLAEVYLKRYVRVRTKAHRIRDLEGYQKYAPAPKQYLLDVLASLRAERALEAGEFKEVVKMLDPLFKRRPVERWINLYLGQAHAALGNDGEALTHLGIATRKTPAPIPGLVALESVYQRQGKKEKQYRVLSRILKHRDRESCSSELMTLFQRRFDSLDQGRLELFRAGMRHLEKENPKLAVECFRKAHGYAPRDEQPLYYLGVAQRYSGEWVGAAKTLERLRRSNPAHPDGLFHLGVVYFHLGQQEKARRCFVDSLLASPPEGSSRQLEIERYLGLLRAREEKR